MAFLKVILLFLFFASSLAVPYRFVDKDEQQFIDHLLLSTRKLHGKEATPHAREEDELENEKVRVVDQEVLKKAHQSQNSKEFQLIKKASLAVVKRLSMPSPPKIDTLIDKAVMFVLKESLPGEYSKIRSGIKEQVDKLMFLNANQESGPDIPKQKVPGLREEKILIALENILSELAVKLNLTTLQIKFLVNSTVNVLSKEFHLNQQRKLGLHERITSHVRDKLKYEDLDNKDGRLRRLEERIEQDILHLKLTNKQAMRLEALVVEAEALKEGLSKSEKLRMLRRVIADIKDDFKTEKLESESAPPKLSSVDVKSINTIIRQRALEMQLTKKELKVLGLAVLSAIEDLTMHTSPPPVTKGTQPTRVSVVLKTSKPKPTNDDDLEQELEVTANPSRLPSKEFISTVEHHSSLPHITHNQAESQTPTPKPTSVDELEEELESTSHPSHRPSEAHITSPSEHKISPFSKHVTMELMTEKATVGAEFSTKKSTEDDLISKLAQDEADLEEQEFHPKTKTESKDDLEIEESEVTHHATEPPFKSKPAKNTITELKPTEPIIVTEGPTKKVSAAKTSLADKGNGHSAAPTTSKIHSTPIKKTLRPKLKPTKETDKDEEKDLLEGHVTKPTLGQDHVTQHQNKPTKEALPTKLKPTKGINKDEEKDLLEGHVTKPVNGHVHVTQHPTEQRTKTTQRAIEVNIGIKHSVSPTGRTTMPKHQTHHITEKHITKHTKKPAITNEGHTITGHIGKVTKEPDIDEEFNQISDRKEKHSRRNRVRILEEDKDLLAKKNKRRHTADLENDLSLLGKPQKEKSLEEELNDILSPKQTRNDESLEEELQDLSVG